MVLSLPQRISTGAHGSFTHDRVNWARGGKQSHSEQPSSLVLFWPFTVSGYIKSAFPDDLFYLKETTMNFQRFLDLISFQ